jgi:hypothetical protein
VLELGKTSPGVSPDEALQKLMAGNKRYVRTDLRGVLGNRHSYRDRNF